MPPPSQNSTVLSTGRTRPTALDRRPRTRPPPYVVLAAMVIGLPVAALVGGWLFGRTPSHLARVRSG